MELCNCYVKTTPNILLSLTWYLTHKLLIITIFKFEVCFCWLYLRLKWFVFLPKSEMWLAGIFDRAVRPPAAPISLAAIEAPMMQLRLGAMNVILHSIRSGQWLNSILLTLLTNMHMICPPGKSIWFYTKHETERIEFVARPRFDVGKYLFLDFLKFERHVTC